jgi:hypothetical protein
MRIVAQGALGAATPARFWLNGVATDVLLGRDNSVMLEVPEAGPGGCDLALRLEGMIASRSRGFALEALELRADPIGRSADPQHTPGWPGGSGRLVPHDLLACATDPAAWHPPDDEAIWLAMQRAELLLPSLPPGTRGIEVTVLALEGQRLEVAIGESQAGTERPGLSTLRLVLPAPTGPEALRLTVICDPLVAAETVGATAPAMLGGALCGIALTRASEAEEAARREIGEGLEGGTALSLAARCIRG